MTHADRSNDISEVSAKLNTKAVEISWSKMNSNDVRRRIFASLHTIQWNANWIAEDPARTVAMILAMEPIIKSLKKLRKEKPENQRIESLCIRAAPSRPHQIPDARANGRTGWRP